MNKFLYKRGIIKMTNTEFIGYLCVYGLVFLGGLVALIKPIISLNVNIQKLTDSINKLSEDNDELKADVDRHEEKIQDHETRLTLIENRDQ